MTGIRVSDDPSELDHPRIHRWILEQSYWATGRTPEKQDAAIAGSWNFGAYDEATGEQIGFARVVTDRATFAWVCDVFVDATARGRGVSKLLMATITTALDEAGIARSMLATADAHGLYAQYGFEALDRPERWMQRTAPARDSSSER